MSVDQEVETADFDPAEADLDARLLGDRTGRIAQDDGQRVEVRLTLFTALELTAPVEFIETICVQIIEPLKEFDETYCMAQGECH